MRKRLFKGKPKRTNFWKMFAVAMILPILITMFVGFNIFSLGHGYIQAQAEKQNNTDYNNLVHRIENGSKTDDEMNRPVEFGLCLSSYRAISTDGIFFNTGAGQYVMATTYDDPKSASAKWAYDENGDIIFSNRARLWIIIRESNDPDLRRYCCYDPQEIDIPEMNELFSQFFKDVEENDIGYEFYMKSLYLNRETNRIIPHEMTVKKYKYSVITRVSDNEYEGNEKAIGTKDVVINADEKGYELLTFADRNEPDSYPRGSFLGLWGVNPERFDEIYDIYKVKNPKNEGFGGMTGRGDNVYDFYSINNELNENKYGAKGCVSVTRINVMNKYAVIKYWLIIAIVFIISTLIALVICLIRNAKNKAQYAFEDYQRALTNNLAHDLKTPLAVIGGYAENLMEMRRESSDEKELRYLSSIMDNVAYTDDIIRKTLKLSETEQTKKLDKTKVDIKVLAEKCAEKYRTALEERGMGLGITGEGTVNANEDSLSLAIDNLISNAVKYTRDDGAIRINVSNKEFVIVNEVAENVDTKELKMPFVKGDKARSDKSSSGLGLSIAEAAAVQNGFTLKLSCKDKKFTAEIKM
ncbi:sensor histidine kinase [Ruminococcus flavefaciens]|uniref:histidine kinase n=1 Tax=Ruminococcus flavefaciens TaxID=1265 RepID=A0A1M7IZQ6_RUMFL|nr:HAMP domain-containing sensor histidine kinase [Ruminococcus flavefaciens]SHM46226.1 histidine kinase [Ruminococcus flavefaciens]